MPIKKIFALGNASPEEYAINKYIVQLSHKINPTLCFLGTAYGDSDSYYERIADGFSSFSCSTKRLSLFKLPCSDLRGYILSSDIVYVGGGNTRSMLALWREWGVDTILREAWEAGIVLCGPSAGSICWFEQGATDSVPGQINPIECLGFLPGSNCPHYGGEPLRRPSYRRLIEDGVLEAGYACDDFAGLLFHNTQIAEVVSARPDARVYRVERRDGEVVETALMTTKYLSQTE